MLPDPFVEELRRLSIAQKLQAIKLLANELEQIAPDESEERDPDQAWFWTPEWQAKEREADEAIARGDVRTFASFDDFADEVEASEA